VDRGLTCFGFGAQLSSWVPSTARCSTRDARQETRGTFGSSGASGGPAQICVHVWDTAQALEFAVCDTGCSFDPSLTPAGAGLTKMCDRVTAIGGTLTVDSNPAHGTWVHGSVPYPSPGEAAQQQPPLWLDAVTGSRVPPVRVRAERRCRQARRIRVAPVDEPRCGLGAAMFLAPVLGCGGDVEPVQPGAREPAARGLLGWDSYRLAQLTVGGVAVDASATVDRDLDVAGGVDGHAVWCAGLLSNGD
jgi:hypothetical protein